ncbi:hypothetical protein DV738_g5161, partial [Chaetothyriales sp. CBS 135597]
MSHARTPSKTDVPIREAAAAPAANEATTAKAKDKKAEKKAKADKPAVKQEAKAGAGGGGGKKKKTEGAALIGIDVSKDVDFSEWYQQVLTKGDMLDYYDISGCYILKPASQFIWDEVRAWFDAKIKSLGIKNCSFPLFVSEEVLNKEKSHIDGFAAEVAWVTHGGSTKLEKKIAIRPTSETVMYPYYAKWVQSYRDLPLKLNQWNSVVRWEFKHPQPFLRTREFHWQEGHTAHLTKAEADKEVLDILDFYAAVYEELLAVPVIKGRKTDKERFAGGDYTTTVEGYIPATGRGIQGGTSHSLGQNFSKMFGISVQDPNAKTDEEKKERLFVWQNSWGLSTRVIGVMVMIHSDDRGLVIPPRVVEIQVAIVPVGITAKTTDEERTALYKEIEGLVDVLKTAGVRVQADFREGYSPGWKFNDWELRGTPLRLEFGPGESKGGYVSTSRRDLPKADSKGQIAIADLSTAVPKLLATIQQDMYDRADKQFKAHVTKLTNWDDFVPSLNDKNICLIPHCLTEECEDQIKEQSARKAEEQSGVPQDERAPSMGAKSLCIPFDQPEGIEKGVTKCTNPKCSRTAEACTAGGTTDAAASGWSSKSLAASFLAVRSVTHPYSSSLGLLQETSDSARAVGNKIPGFRTSAAFLTTLRANLAIDIELDSAPSSQVNTPDSLRPVNLSSSTGSLPPPSPLGCHESNEMSAPSSDENAGVTTTSSPLDGIPSLVTKLAVSEDDKVDALKLVADSVAQQRQYGSSAMIFHPITAAALVAIVGITYAKLYKGSQADWAVVGTTVAGALMASLITIRYFTRGYIEEAERVGTWKWLDEGRGGSGPDQADIAGKEDEILLTRYGQEAVGALIMRGVRLLPASGSGSGSGSVAKRSNSKKSRRHQNGASSHGGSRGVPFTGLIRGFSTTNRYRRKGIGTELLEEAIKICQDKGWQGPDFAADHANSARFLPLRTYDGPFEKRDRDARRLLERVKAENIPNNTRNGGSGRQKR